PPVPPPPPVAPPGAPQAVVAAAGDESATLTWRPASENGAPILRYVVEGDGIDEPIEVGASQFEVEITGLTNGQTYVFTVHAVNSEGAGPRASSNPVVPTRDVPDPPTEVEAVANPDGSVDLTWTEANGQGHAIAQYRVTSLSGKGATSALGAVTDTSMHIDAGVLEYGTQYEFTVIAINDVNAASDESDPSNTVIPFTVPGAPLDLVAATDPGRRGAIRLSWTAPAGNGRPITGYEVELPDGTIQEVTGTSTTVTGLPDDTSVRVKVRAVNEAGAGPDATASARTMGAPTITVTGQQRDYRSIGVTVTPNAKGGDATCRFEVAGAGATEAACGTAAVTLTVGGLWPNNTYDYTVTITNAVGSASANGSLATNDLRATVVCNDQSYCGSGIYIYNTPSQANPANAVGTFRGGNTFIPQCRITGSNVNATPWGGKNTSAWLRLTYNGKTAYFPHAWAVLDGGDNLSNIPNC
ncbi:MAG: fibronectin type III domain-containing protein, partial [Micromonosporaceae bacterium]|nr:fibronectin type III domain-containing protein [Micromonosporaceae bacterium]